MGDVEKTLKIFQAMDGIAVARRCAELTQEIYDVAKISMKERRNQRAEISNGQTQPQGATDMPNRASSLPQPSIRFNATVAESIGPAQPPELMVSEDSIHMDGFNQQDDFFADILDGKILDNFNTYLPELDIDSLPYEGMDPFWDIGA
jgi:hypothetical protein